MAENESLDLGRARRWRQVLNAVVSGQPTDQIALLVLACVRQTLKKLRSPIVQGRPPQIPFAALLDAVFGDRGEFRRIVNRCQGHEFAQLFYDCTFGALSREDAVERFLLATFDRYADQIVIEAAKADNSHTFPQVQSLLDHVRARVEPGLRDIAQQLAVDPN
ncbi:unnamed protein product, partial [marine sediment metagenome]